MESSATLRVEQSSVRHLAGPVIEGMQFCERCGLLLSEPPFRGWSGENPVISFDGGMAPEIQRWQGVVDCGSEPS